MITEVICLQVFCTKDACIKFKYNHFMHINALALPNKQQLVICNSISSVIIAVIVIQ